MKVQHCGINTNANCNVTIDSCEIMASSIKQAYGIRNNTGTMKVNNSSITSSVQSGENRGIYNQGTAELTNNNIYVDSQNGGAFGVINSGTADLTNNNITVDAPDKASEGIWAYGIQNTGKLKFYSGKVIGVLVGIMSGGSTSETYVYGGTFASPVNGGFGFLGGKAYIENATISCIEYEGKYSIQEENYQQCGVYVQGSSIDIYLNNCTIRGGKEAFIIGGTSNVVNISNSTIGDNYEAEKPIRIADSTSKLNIGTGCNFDANDATIPDSVEITNEVYTNK